MNTSNAHISAKVRPKGPIYNITPFTLLDYPDKSACIVWFAGCNMRCLYCYNPEIVLGKGTLDFEDIYRFLESRKGLLDGVVLSGGECTLHRHLHIFITTIKAMGFAVKIDTNGSNPLLLKQLLLYHLIDYVSLDFKALPNQFQHITQSDLFSDFEQSLSLLLTAGIPFEIRTTVHSDLIPESDFIRMVDYLEEKGYTGNYYIQHYMNNVPTLSKLDVSQIKLKKENFYSSKICLIFRE
ncbi:anaerobic ribonucleoside-triphosphate reductase activating protein [Flavobacterium inviolabile]|uniref:anaerobic ribonucleoside-triphosphate reductase activating protein n=1 Tax=Flavobacterium inviolabile TaxID=2748320 RepID=UPI0015B10039|nr:anaerobic ribonucleoside-triphosphate reductase activating protein [Flavobacterium inviolabile]